eukprot:gene6812-10977_t
MTSKEQKPKKKRLSFTTLTETVDFDNFDVSISKKSPKSTKSSGSDDIFDDLAYSASSFLSSEPGTPTADNFQKVKEKKGNRSKSVFDFFTKKSPEPSPRQSSLSSPLSARNSFFRRSAIDVKKSSSLTFENPFKKEIEEELKKQNCIHTDYVYFREVDFEDYSYVKEPISWITKEFNKTENIMEDEVINPLFEKFTEILNPLYDEFFEYKNPEADELIEYVSPIFDGTTNFLSETLNDIRLISILQKLLVFEDRIIQKKQGIKLQMKYQCFLGENLTNQIYILGNPYFTKLDAIAFCQNMMDKYSFKNVDNLSSTIFSESDYYRFTDYWDFFNEKQMNSRVLTAQMEENFIPFELKIDSYVIIRTIDNLMHELYENHIKTNLYSKNFNKNVGYLVVWKSTPFEELKREVYKLQKVNLLEFNENVRKSFLINLYNLMVLHALMICKKPEKLEQRTQMFQKYYYIVGNHKWTISSLENLLTSRENNQPIGFKFDPRIHFCLHQGTLGCPIFRYYPWDHFYYKRKHHTLDYQIKFSTKFFIKKEIKINDEEEIIQLPFIFKKHADAFGDSIDDQLNWISKYIQKKENQRQEFIEKMKKYKIEYFEENVKFNRRTFKEEILEFILPFPEVRDKPRFRKYFIKFCEKEMSIENIECYQAIEEFNKIDNPNERYYKAVEIYMEFLSPGVAPKEININTKQIYRVRDEINIEKASLDKSENYKPNVVTTLFEEIKQCLNRVMIDTYSRFILSDGYYELVEQCLDEILDRNSNDDRIDKKIILKKALGY